MTHLDELLISDLSVEYLGARSVQAVANVCLEVKPEATVGLVGESGSGKSTLARAVMRLLPSQRVSVEGRVLWRSQDLLRVSDDTMRRIRLREIAYVPQASMNALNPVVNVGKQFERSLAGSVRNRDEALERAATLCKMVELDPAVLGSFAHQLSGGTRQRLILAMALSLGPRIVIMDEATTGLDVLVQQKIVDRLRSLQTDQGFSLVFVSHDLALIADITNTVAVMYAGRIVELGPTADVYDRPLHPYTIGLRRSVIDLGRKGTVEPMSGFAPSTGKDSAGCAFAARCWFAKERCWTERPSLVERDLRHSAACHFAEDARGFRDQLGL